ncbi:MAG: YggT family protein [Pseudomonadota bacterium]
MSGFTGLFLFLQMLIGWFIFIIVIDVILTLLISFGVLNAHNGVVSFIHRATYAVTEPVLRPIRRRLPAINGIDLSPLVLIFGLYFLSWVVIGNCGQPGFVSGALCG